MKIKLFRIEYHDSNNLLRDRLCVRNTHLRTSPGTSPGYMATRVRYTRVSYPGALYPGVFTRVSYPGALYVGTYNRGHIPGCIYPGM